MKQRHSITGLGGALEDALQEFGLQKQVKEQEVIARWTEIVGKAIANHSKPTRIENGTLWIHVQNAVWRQEISLHRMELMKKINDAIGYDLIKDLILR